MKIKISNCISNSGNSVANQFIIRIGTTTYFQSYDSIIVKITSKHVYLDKNTWNYSATTDKYRNQFLNECIADTKAKIKSGEYKLRDLN